MTIQAVAGSGRGSVAWRRPETATAPVRMFCFPFAGGTAAQYRYWGARLGPWIDVCPVELPGHGTRYREPVANSMCQLVEELGSALWPLMDRPFALFGHSMGASVAFALAAALASVGGPTPATVIVSAARAPDDREQKRVGDLSEERFRNHLRRMNGIPPEV